jgi:hypothetical protein
MGLRRKRKTRCLHEAAPKAQDPMHAVPNIVMDVQTRAERLVVRWYVAGKLIVAQLRYRQPRAHGSPASVRHA